MDLVLIRSPSVPVKTRSLENRIRATEIEMWLNIDFLLIWCPDPSLVVLLSFAGADDY